MVLTDKHYYCVYFSDYIGPIIGGVVAFVVLIAVIFILCCVIKKQQARRNALIPTTVYPGAANVSAYHKERLVLYFTATVELKNVEVKLGSFDFSAMIIKYKLNLTKPNVSR